MVGHVKFINEAGEFNFEMWLKIPDPPALKASELLGLFQLLLCDMIYPLISKQTQVYMLSYLKITPLSILDWPPLCEFLCDVPLVKLRTFPGIPLDMVIRGAAPSVRSLPLSASMDDLVEFFGKWATSIGERRKLKEFLILNDFTTLGKCCITPEMVDRSDMRLGTRLAVGTRLALKCFLTRVYFFQRDESLTSMERFYELLSSRFGVPEGDLGKFRELGYGLRNLVSVNEYVLVDAGISRLSARQIVVAKLVYADRPEYEKFCASSRIT